MNAASITHQRRQRRVGAKEHKVGVAEGQVPQVKHSLSLHEGHAAVGSHGCLGQVHTRQQRQLVVLVVRKVAWLGEGGGLQWGMSCRTGKTGGRQGGDRLQQSPRKHEKCLHNLLPFGRVSVFVRGVEE
jgi:hypothetical protein